MLNCVAALSLREAARRSIFFSLVLSFLPCSRPNRPFKTSRKRLKKKEKKRNQKKKEQIDYPVTTTQNIQKSARFSFRVVWFVHAPVTHPTLQPSLTVSIIFLFISIYFRFFLSFSLRLFFCCIFSVAYSPTSSIVMHA